MKEKKNVISLRTNERRERERERELKIEKEIERKESTGVSGFPW